MPYTEIAFSYLISHSVLLCSQDSLAIADEVIQGQKEVEDKDGKLTFYTYDIVSPVREEREH